MSDVRQSILSDISNALGLREKDAIAIAQEAKNLIADPAIFQPKFDDQRNVERFIGKATSERVTATVASVDTMAKVPSAVTDYLKENELAPTIALQPRKTLMELNWGAIQYHNDIAPNESIAVSIADLAVAETGSVVFLSAPDSPTLMNFLPLHHLVVVEASLIHRHLEDVFTFVGADQRLQPRNLNIVTGTSGTADIEAKNIRGAHGPRFMKMIIVGQV